MLNLLLGLLLVSTVHHSTGVKQCIMKNINTETPLPSPNPSPSPSPSPVPSGRMTNRFPLACKSKFTSPYSYSVSSNLSDELCFEFNKNNCGNSNKCTTVQTTLRKMMVSTLQDPLCGAKQLYKEGPYSSAAREYNIELKDPNGNTIDGSSIAHFWHTWQNKTEKATDLYFKPQGDMTGYVLCISGDNTRKCLLNKDKKMCISVYDVSDHSCDNCQLIDFS